jgi:glutamyl-tRNA synthetase/glutamyl-Q tRNA(Asp) synthetase
MDRLPSTSWRTRFAPAPTGYLHLGHAVNALFVWGLARAFGGRVVLRIEDHDRTRSRPEYEAALREDLEWLGLAPDEEAPRQSERAERYEEVLATLAGDGLTYACTCTRKQIRSRLGQAGGRRGGEIWYPGTCRDRGIDPATTPIRRLRLAPREIAFDDLALGPRRQTPSEQCGDLLLRNRAGHWSYHFAVVVDDLDQGIDVVIRGEDLLASTGRQIQLAGLLRDGPPRAEAGRAEALRYLHHPLILDASGRKLSKSRGDTGVRELRAAGWTAERVLGEAAYRAGLREGSRPLDLAGAAELLVRWTGSGGPNG